MILLCSFLFLFAFLYAIFVQCGQGSTDDELSPTCVSSLLGVEIQGVAAGLWHTMCTSVDGGVYSFGGNQFGQLGTGSDQAEVHSSHHSGITNYTFIFCIMRYIVLNI